MLTSGSSGLYLFLYGIFYYSTKVRPRIRMPNRTPGRLPGWADRNAPAAQYHGVHLGAHVLWVHVPGLVRVRRRHGHHRLRLELRLCPRAPPAPRASSLLCVRATTRRARADPLTSGRASVCRGCRPCMQAIYASIKARTPPVIVFLFLLFFFALLFVLGVLMVSLRCPQVD